MEPLIVDGIDDGVIERLHAPAASNGRSVDDEVLEIIKAALAADDQDVSGPRPSN